MRPIQHKGTLTTWKDDRGFGFIKPDGGGKEVFLHISALKATSCRPKVGDTILYEKVTEAGGKIRAAKALIQGVPNRSSPTQRKTRKRRRGRGKTSLVEALIRASILVVIAFFAIELNPNRYPSLVTSITKPGCDIKGNISVSTGNKIYHLPGMEDYKSTIIDPAKGEKWFCSESEAIANGWRKAPR